MNKKLIFISLLFICYHFSCSRDDGGSYNETYYSVEDMDLHVFRDNIVAAEGDTVDINQFSLGADLAMTYMVAEVHHRQGGGSSAYAEDTPPAVLGTKGLKDSLVQVSLINAYPLADTLPAGTDLSPHFSWRYYSFEEPQNIDKLVESLNSSAPHDAGLADFQLIPSFDPDGVKESKYTLRFTFASGKVVAAESVRFFVK